MSNLIDIQSQIKTLQKQAEEIKARDFDGTVKEIKATMQLFGITIKHIQAPALKQKKTKSDAYDVETRKVRPASIALGKIVVAKYRGPEGQTWSGRGLSPKWLTTLVTHGAKREDFLIQKESFQIPEVPASPDVPVTPEVLVSPEVPTEL